MPWANSGGEADGIDGNNIVGSYLDTSGHRHGYLFDGTAWTTLDMPGATWTSAEGINGNNIVGTWFDGSHYHGYIYTIPEPGSAALLGLAGATLLVWRRWRRQRPNSLTIL